MHVYTHLYIDKMWQRDSIKAVFFKCFFLYFLLTSKNIKLEVVPNMKENNILHWSQTW